VLAADGEFGEPVASVEEEEQVDVALAFQFFGDEESSEAELVALAGRGGLGEAGMLTGVLDHRGRALRKLGTRV
jgi:hypothetical protein